MKKLLAGCLVVVALGVVAIGVVGYVGYRAARPMIDGATGWIGQARELAEAGDRIENRAAFTAPETGELDEARVKRFLAVHERVRSSLGPRWADIETRARDVESRAREDGREPSLTEIGAMLSDVGTLLLEARRAHVDALNAERFSWSEYSWVRLRVYEAAGIELVEAVDWSQLEAMVAQSAAQAGVSPPEVKLPEIPEVNRALVKPHTDALQTWLPLAIIGF